MLTSQLLFHPRAQVSACGNYAILYTKGNEIHVFKIIGDGLVEDWSRSYHDGSLDNPVATAAKPSSSCCHRLAPASWSIQTLPREKELAHNDEEDEEDIFKIDQHPGKSNQKNGTTTNIFVRIQRTESKPENTFALEDRKVWRHQLLIGSKL